MAEYLPSKQDVEGSTPFSRYVLTPPLTRGIFNACSSFILGRPLFCFPLKALPMQGFSKP